LQRPREFTGIWELEIRDGIPWAKPPTWLDPQQRWRRNTYQHHLHTTEQLAIDIQGRWPGGCDDTAK
jgi:hypothetical protein